MNLRRNKSSELSGKQKKSWCVIHGRFAALLLICCLWINVLEVKCEQQVMQSRITYVYVTACGSCARVSKVLEELPEQLEVQTETGNVITSVHVEKLELSENLEQVEQLFTDCDIPADERITPVVFLGNDCLMGADEIEKYLLQYLQEGKGLSTDSTITVDSWNSMASKQKAEENSAVAEVKKDQGDSEALSWTAVFAAGVVSGLNPCALSMLLLFLTTVMSMNRNPVRYAAVFLGSKFIVYMLIGTVLFQVFQAWNPVWLPDAAKWLLTVVGGILVIANILDAVAAHREQYGKIHNQLPAKIRGFLQSKIKKASSSSFLTFTVLILGIVVALSEFMCAGQIYLAGLLAAVQANVLSVRWLLMLALYCFAFLIPALILCIVVFAGKSLLSVSAWLLERMSVIKILTSLVLIFLIVAAWLL